VNKQLSQDEIDKILAKNELILDEPKPRLTQRLTKILKKLGTKLRKHATIYKFEHSYYVKVEDLNNVFVDLEELWILKHV